jgi:hypothetical protein
MKAGQQRATECGKCFAFSEGKICQLSKELKDNFGVGN